MKAGGFTYEVGIFVDFTDDELDLLRRCCAVHYDGRVKAAAKQGGFLYGWLNARSMGIDLKCSFSHLDTCAKALEQPTEWREKEAVQTLRWDLRHAIMGILRNLNEEHVRLSQSAESEWAGGRSAKIASPDGAIVFEGNIDMFRNCFFDNAEWGNVTAWAEAEGLVAELV